MAAQTWTSAVLTGADNPVKLHDGRVSATYFDIFGVQLILGRTFASDEDQPGRELKVVLSLASGKAASEPITTSLANRSCSTASRTP